MKKNKLGLWLIAGAVVLLLAGFYLLSRASSSERAESSDPMQSMHNAVSGNGSKDLSSLIGKPMPAFSLKDKSGAVYSAESLKGKDTILFFNEGLMCYPSCWNQMVSLAKDSRFEGPGVQALSVVVDSAGDWSYAVNKMPDLARATVLFDPDKTFSRMMGMLSVPSSMHPGSYPGHSYLLVDKDGIVRFAFDDPRMGLNDDLLAAKLQELQ